MVIYTQNQHLEPIRLNYEDFEELILKIKRHCVGQCSPL